MRLADEGGVGRAHARYRGQPADRAALRVVTSQT